MPQVQKDDVRETILDSAREEFLEHGFEGSSMRRIALRSKMTVGNLYRYFKNKEELSSIIVSPTLKIFDDTVKELSGGLISFGAENEQLDMPLPLIKERLSTMSDRLVDIYDSHRIEVSILMMGTELNKKITDWFANLIAALIAGNFGMLDRRDERLAILSQCYAHSIFSGIKTILRESKSSKEDMRLMVKIYLNSFLSMLDNDISALM